MLQSDYIRELDALRVSEDFLRRTMTLLEKEQATQTPVPPPAAPFKTAFPTRRFAAAAASLALVAGLAIFAARQPQVVPSPGPSSTLPPVTTPPADPELPILTVPFEPGGMGFEGMMVRQAEDLAGGSPWAGGAMPATLPVYRVAVPPRDAAGRFQGGLSAEEMFDRAVAMAEALDLTVEEVQLSPTDRQREALRKKGADPDEPPYRATALCTDDTQVHIDLDGTVYVVFGEVRQLPGGLEMGFGAAISSKESALRTVDYLLAEYGPALGLREPKADVWVDYTYDGAAQWALRAYEGAGPLEDQLLSYSRGYLDFHPAEGGGLRGFRLFPRNLGDKLGDYPIISLEEATGMLQEGRALTTVPEGYYGAITDNLMGEVQLCYRNANEPIAMPFYRFYVLLSDQVPWNMSQDLVTYGAFYVPAVEPRYLAGLPEPTLQFN